LTHSTIQLVCFDLGGVLIRICDGWAQAAQLADVKLPKPPNPEDVLPLTREFETGRLDEQQFCDRVAPIVGIPPQEVRSLVHAWLRGPYQQTDKLIDDLHRNQVPTACLSNTNQTHWDMMHSTGSNYLPLESLTFRFASHLIGAMKPTPDIYTHLEEQTGVAPESILYFDDNAENCKAAGDREWHVYQIDPSGDTARQIAEVLRSYRLI